MQQCLGSRGAGIQERIELILVNDNQLGVIPGSYAGHARIIFQQRHFPDDIAGVPNRQEHFAPAGILDDL